MKFSDAVERMRGASGITYSEASTKMGRAPQYISVMRQKSSSPRLETCIEVARAFGFRLIVRSGEHFFVVREDDEHVKKENEVPAEDIVRRIVDACPQSNYSISKRMNKPTTYVASLLNRGGIPSISTLVALAEACDFEVILRGYGRRLYLSKRLHDGSEASRGSAEANVGTAGVRQEPPYEKKARELQQLVDGLRETKSDAERQQAFDSYDAKNEADVNAKISQEYEAFISGSMPSPEAETANGGTEEASSGLRVDKRDSHVEVKAEVTPGAISNIVVPSQIETDDFAGPVSATVLTPEQEKLAQYAQGLLDLSMRNNMLNYRDRKAGTIRIQAPEATKLFKRIVDDEKQVRFAENNPELFEELLRDRDTRSGELAITERSRAELLRSLRRLETVARTSIEEQGINILHVAFGLLHYIGADEKEHDAPLVLVPVRISRASARSGYVLQSGDDDPVANPTLLYFMKTEFGIELPEFDDGSRLANYLNAVAGKVQTRAGWYVTKDVVLSTFQFQKLSLYHDLQNRAKEILVHPVVQAIVDDNDELAFSMDDVVLDELPPEETYQVVDADASQQEAILAAHRGKSFVLQGPPGTGKSQTITNIIADCLGSGKTVLFVSEKKAALDVVYTRLQRAGLDDFCLVLHSNKTSKRDVLSQLDKTAKLADTRPSVPTQAKNTINNLIKVRRSLNGYADQIDGRIQPLGLSPYEAIGITTRFEKDGVPFFICKLERVADIDQPGLAAMEQAVRALSDALIKLGRKPNENPWDPFGLTGLDYGESDALLEDARAIASWSEQLATLHEQVSEELGPTARTSWAGMDALAQLLEDVGNMPIVPTGMIGESADDMRQLVSNALELRAQQSSEIKELAYRLSNLAGLDPDLDLAFDEAKLGDIGYVEGLYGELSRRLDSLSHYAAWQRVPAGVVDAATHELMSSKASYDMLRDTVLEQFHPEILRLDFRPMEARFKTDYRGLFYRFNSQYKEDKRLLNSLFRLSREVEDGEATKVLSQLHDLSDKELNLEGRADYYRSALGDCYQGVQTSFEQIDHKRQVLAFALSCLDAIDVQRSALVAVDAEKERMSEVFGGLYDESSEPWADDILLVVDRLRELREKYSDSKQLASLGGLEQHLSDPRTPSAASDYARKIRLILGKGRGPLSRLNAKCHGMNLETQNLRTLDSRLRQAAASGAREMDLSADYHEAKGACSDLGLLPFVDALVSDPRSGEIAFLEDADRVFQHTFYRQWLGDVVWKSRPALQGFSEREHNRDIGIFTDLDEQQLEIDKARTLAKLFPNIPSSRGKGFMANEMRILTKEINKQRRIRPIRKLFADIPDVVLALKPCLMMSPLSVSTYLESAQFKFDTVIFDEASQVKTEDALGVISRGKQVIIAGDSKQLPPTNFFNATVNEEGDEEDEDYYEQGAGAYDSVLAQASALNPITLKWHYRSRDESLITFSNQEIYDGGLFTFPSSVASGRDVGVEFMYVPNGVYEGSRKGNPIEAKRVADLVFQHFATYGGERSLGVIALGENQSRVIENEILDRRIEHPELDEFFDSGRDEPFFVKNLENVQGDERDSIILGVGYAKGENGRLSHNFGPINLDGGERRLNVATTRARINLKLVTSLDPAEIDASRVTNDGPKLLKGYLEYAKMGAERFAQNVRREFGLRAEDEFASVVRDVLTEAGFDVEERVGNSDCKVDLAVRHPERKDCFCIGVMLDGDSYHAASTARDRDRLRTSVLEGMGWKLHHVWSREWLDDPEGQKKNLLAAVERAIKEFEPPAEREPVIVPEPVTKPEKGQASARVETSTVAEEPAGEVPAVGTDASGQRTVLSAVSARVQTAIDHEESTVVESPKPESASERPKARWATSSTIYGFERYSNHQLPERGSIDEAEFLRQLINSQAPFSKDYMLRRFKDFFSPESARLSRPMQKMAEDLLKGDLKSIASIRNQGGRDYVFRKGRKVLPRVAAGRDPRDISLDELSGGVIQVLRQHGQGLNREDLIVETAYAFEFEDLTPDVEKAIGASIGFALRNKLLELRDDRYIIASK